MYYIHIQGEKKGQTFGDGRGDQGKNFEIGQSYLELLLDRSFKLKHTLRNPTSIQGYWVSD
jgi:hypothetical protein